MDDFHCSFLELMIRLDADQIDKDALLKEVGMENKDKMLVPFLFDSRDAPNEQHVHLDIRFRPQEPVRIEIEYHNSAGNFDEEAKAPFMEESTQWLSKYVKVETVRAHINATYRFGKEFASRVLLPFPLMSSDKELSGALVTGLAMEFPPDFPLQATFVQTKGNRTTVSIHTDSEIKLSSFDLYEELARLASATTSLLRKKEESK
jgi:hypothetical protein